MRPISNERSGFVVSEKSVENGKKRWEKQWQCFFKNDLFKVLADGST